MNIRALYSSCVASCCTLDFYFKFVHPTWCILPPLLTSVPAPDPLFLLLTQSFPPCTVPAAVARTQLSHPTLKSAAPLATPSTPPSPVDLGPVLGGTGGNTSAGNSVQVTLAPLALSLITGLLAFASF